MFFFRQSQKINIFSSFFSLFFPWLSSFYWHTYSKNINRFGKKFLQILNSKNRGWEEFFAKNKSEYETSSSAFYKISLNNNSIESVLYNCFFFSKKYFCSYLHFKRNKFNLIWKIKIKLKSKIFCFQRHFQLFFYRQRHIFIYRNRYIYIRKMLQQQQQIKTKNKTAAPKITFFCFL